MSCSSSLQKTSIAMILQDIPLFSDMSESELRQYTSQAICKQYAKKHLLFLHDDAASSFYIIYSGWVKLFHETLDGDEAIVDIITHGQMFGDMALFGNGTNPYSAEIVEDAVLYELPLSVLREHIANSNKLALNMLHTMSAFRRKQTRELEHMKIQNAPQRIGCFLLQLCNTSKPAPYRVHLPYDKMLVAARIGMQPETFSRALLKLQKETNIRIQGATIEIDDISILTNYSCSACSSSYPCQD